MKHLQDRTRQANARAPTRALCRKTLMMGVLAGAGVVACSTPPKPATMAFAPVVCADFNFPIYFEKGSDQLSAPAQQELIYTASRVKGCKLGSIAVLGLADADGAPRSNLALSRKRAAVVAHALAAAGLPTPTFDIEALGESGAVSPGGQPEPLRRRTEVVIHASAPDAARP